MSLTSFIKIPAVRAIFKKEFPLERIKLEGELTAPPITKNYPLVGTAFDYLFRFYLEHKNPNCITKRWVAEASVLRMDLDLETGLTEDRQGIDLLKTSKKMKDLLDKSKKIQAKFQSNGKLDDEIIQTAVTLAQMDVYYRQGLVPSNLGTVEEGDIKDMRNLISLVDADLFKAKKHCYLNPTFGYGSTLVGGADADLIVDNALIDIKTTKNLAFTQEMFNQLIGYYILAKLGEVNESQKIPIEKVGIYYSRHGILHTISAKEIEGNPNFPKFMRVFEKLADAVFSKKN